jgi:hypothetical protein
LLAPLAAVAVGGEEGDGLLQGMKEVVVGCVVGVPLHPRHDVGVSVLEARAVDDGVVVPLQLDAPSVELPRAVLDRVQVLQSAMVGDDLDRPTAHIRPELLHAPDHG